MNNSNQNPNKRRINYNTQQQRRPAKRQKVNPQNNQSTNNRGRGRGRGRINIRGRGRGLRARLRGRGRGGIANVKKIINQNLQQNTNQSNTNANNPRKVVTSTTTTSNINTNPNNPNNFTISRTIQNKSSSNTSSTSIPQQTQETAEQKAARLRQTLLNNMKSSPQKTTTTQSKLVSGIMTPTQIENQQRKKMLVQRLQNRQNITKPIIKTNTASNTNNTSNISNISPLSALKQKALQSMQPKLPIQGTKTNQNQSQKQKQATSSAALENEKRKQLLMKNTINKQQQTANKNKQSTIITKPQPTIKLTRPSAFANLISTPIFKSTLNPNASVFKNTTISKPKPIQPTTKQRPVPARGPTSIPKPKPKPKLKPKPQIVAKKQPIQSKPSQAAKAVSSPSSSAVPRRQLKQYRTLPKTKQNMSFTTTLFDNQHHVVQTTISTNADNKNITKKPTIPIVAGNRNIKPQHNVVKKPRVDKIPAIPSLPQLPTKLPSTPSFLTPKPIKQVIQSTPKPVTKLVVKPKTNENLPLDAPKWSCQFCTFINENNTGVKCGMCMQDNYIKTPVPEATNAPKPPKPVSIPSSASCLFSQPSLTTPKPTIIAIQPPTLHASKPKPIIPVKSTPIISNKLPTTTATKPAISAPIPSIKTTAITIAKQPTSKPINIAPPIKQPKPSGMPDDNKSMDSVWAQRDKAILERKEQQLVAKAPKQIISKIVQKASPTSWSISKPIKPMKPIQKRPIVQKAATTTIKSTQIELQRKKMIAQKQQKPNVVKSSSTGVAQKGKPLYSLSKKIISSNVGQSGAVSISMKDYWKMDVKHKVNNKTLELFIKETDQFIKEMNNEGKLQCNLVGIEYKDAMSMDNDVMMVDIVKDFEWTKKICLENQVKWPNNFDLNAFEKVVTECSE